MTTTLFDRLMDWIWPLPPDVSVPTETYVRDGRLYARPRKDEAVLRVEYTAYLCTLCDHGCQCLALSFDEWKALVSS